MPSFRSEAFFMPGGIGRRFCILHHPKREDQVRGIMVHVHAFAEEMNKCRRMVALACQAFAERGWAVLLPDLAGCGDSEGELKDARWEMWIDEILSAYSWAVSRFGGARWLWGMRAGALIAGQAGSRLGGVPSLLLWQPVVSGEIYLNQFLRMRLTRDLDSIGVRTETTRSLRERLNVGEALDVAGYVIHPSLAAGLSASELVLDTQRGSVVWCEISLNPGQEHAPGIQSRIEGLLARGIQVETIVAVGPPFWQTVEVCEAPDLIAMSLHALRSTDHLH